MSKIKSRILRHKQQAISATVFALMQYISAVSYYTYRFIDKLPEKTSILTGNQYVAELLDGNPRRFARVSRMSRNAFNVLCAKLRDARPGCILFALQQPGIQVKK